MIHEKYRDSWLVLSKAILECQSEAGGKWWGYLGKVNRGTWLGNCKVIHISGTIIRQIHPVTYTPPLEKNRPRFAT